jgi:hypothetical protein
MVARTTALSRAEARPTKLAIELQGMGNSQAPVSGPTRNHKDFMLYCAWLKTIELPKSSDGRLSILVRLKNPVLSQFGQQAVTQLDGFLDTHVVHNLSPAPGFLGKPIAKYTGAEPRLNRQRRIPQRQAILAADGHGALIAAERIGAFYSAQTNSVSAVSPTQRWV